MIYLEFLGLVLGLIFISQIGLPLLFPNTFQFFWLFRQKRQEVIPVDEELSDLDKEADSALELERLADEKISKTLSKVEEKEQAAARIKNNNEPTL